MAIDFLLLKRYPHPEAVRFRHYGWCQPAFSFGYGQAVETVRGRLPDRDAELVRRFTGGGLVDHRRDWTYALVIPRPHPLCKRPARDSYRTIHDVIRNTLAARGHPVALKEPGATGSRQRAKAPGVCFEEPEDFDVIRSDNGAKVAGAAQKRTTKGLLFQGSLERTSLPETDWDALPDLLAGELASALDAERVNPGWPDFSPEEESTLTEQFASAEWLERR